MGVLPSHLLDNEKSNKHFGFHGLKEHMQLRLEDHSLLTSDCVNFDFDCVLNLKMHGQYSEDFFKRGVQDIIIYNSRVTQFDNETSNLMFDKADTRVNVNRQAAVMATETPHAFVTVTANFKQTTGLSQLYSAVESIFASADDEIKKAAVQSCMVIGLRVWEQFIEFLLN